MLALSIPRPCKVLTKRLTMIRNLQRDRKVILENPEFETNDQLSWQEALIADRITYLKKVNSHNNRARLRAKIAHHGERLGGIWSNLNKVRKPRDIIPRLAEPDTNPPQYETSSRKMANLAMRYHNSLQEKGLPQHHAPLENTANTNDPTPDTSKEIDEVMEAIPECQKFSQECFPELSKGVTLEHVKKALMLAKNNSATGLDSCPYELWKKLDKLHIEAQKMNHHSFNIVGILTAVFQDIQRHGIAQDTKFTEGWMCPISKKKDRVKIENYRPIMLLNSDYKLFTKALSLQLLDPIDAMIH